MNLLAKRRENPPSAPGLRYSSADELFFRLLQSYLPEESCDLFPGMEQEFEIGEKEISLSLPCPGRKKEEIDVEIMGDLLTVKSCSCADKGEPQERSCVFSERCDSMCVASFRIPVKVIGKEAKANCQDGVLTVRIPRDLTKQETLHPIKISCK